jgi:hypothetical protein
MYFNNVLYFPHIQVPNSTWFTRTLLYWDKVGAIVPSDYINNPERFGQYTKELVQTKLLIRVVPGRYIGKVPNFSQAFLTYLHSLGAELKQRQDAFKSVDGTWSIHAEKMEPLAEPLTELGLAKRLQYPWYKMEKDTATDFMGYLAAVLGSLDDVQCTPITDEIENLNHFIRAGTLHRNGLQELERLRCDVLEDLFPAPAIPLSPSEIAKFKERHGELLRNFRLHVEKQLIEMASISDPGLRNYRLNIFWDETHGTVDEIKARLNESGWPDLILGKFGSIVGEIPGVPFVSLISAFYNALKPKEVDIKSSPLLYAAYAQEDLLEAHKKITIYRNSRNSR